MPTPTRSLMVAPALNSPSGADVAEEVIRQLLRSSKIPLHRVVQVVREQARAQAGDDAALTWELSAAEGDEAKPMIEARSGTSISTEELAARMRVSSQTVRNRVESGELISYPPLRGRGLRFPTWQFNDKQVLPWVAKLIAAYGGNGWGLLDFLTVPRDSLGGINYLARLQQGSAGVEAVVAAAKRVNLD